MIEDFSQLIRNAANGDDYALNTLLNYFKQQAVSDEEQEQLHLYIKQASKFSHDAIYLRAILYDCGYGVKQDYEMAFILLREAASKGNVRATYEVGRHFYEGLGVDKNDDNAFQWFKIAAGSPNYVTDAMYSLAEMYEQGRAVESNHETAMMWYEKAAQKGHPKAQEKILNRSNGVTKS